MSGGLPASKQADSAAPVADAAVSPSASAATGRNEGGALLDRAAAATASSGTKTLYVGNLHFMVNEQVLTDIFATLGPVKEVKIIKARVTGLSAGFGFVEYVDARCADLALNSINGRVLYGQEVRVNWAYQRTDREDTSNHFHIFVGDLSSEVNDRTLFESFAGVGNCSDARVMWDHSTGRSKGYGFVSFRTREDADRAIEMMDGQQVGNRRVRCGWAQHKQDNSLPMDEVTVDRADPTNTNVYIGNISPEVSDAELKRHFTTFGHVLEVKLYRKGSYGFIRYQKHRDAVRAIVGSSGLQLGDRPLKCSWGRFQSSHKGKADNALAAAMAAVGLGGQMMPPGTLMPGPQGMIAHAPVMLAPAQGMMMQRPMQSARPGSAVGQPNASAMPLDPSMYYPAVYYQ